LFIDFLFIFDIFVNFICAYEDEETGILVVSLRKISTNYMRSWFFIDLIAVLPVQLLEKIGEEDTNGQ